MSRILKKLLFLGRNYTHLIYGVTVIIQFFLIKYLYKLFMTKE